MAKWVKNAIGLAFVLVILGVAKQAWFDSADVEFDITEGTARSTNVRQSSSSSDPVIVKATTVAECSLSEHGIESWGKTQIWTADSGWRGGGSSPGEFCGAQKLTRESQFPNRAVVLVDTPPESHKSVRNPFKHDYYRYMCVFEDRWEPTYKLEPNEKCATSS